WHGVGRAPDGIAAVGLDLVQVPRVAPGIAGASHGPHVLLLGGILGRGACDEGGHHEEGEELPRSGRPGWSTHTHLAHKGWSRRHPSRFTGGMAMRHHPTATILPDLILKKF